MLRSLFPSTSSTARSIKRLAAMAATYTTLSAGPTLTTHDLLSLPRPSAAVLNPAGTKAVWPSSTFSFEGAGGKGRTEKAIYLVDLPTAVEGQQALEAEPKVLLGGLALTEVVWADDKTILFVRPAGVVDAAKRGEGEGEHAVDVSNVEFSKRLATARATAGGEGVEVWAKDVVEGDEYIVGTLPVAVSNLKIKEVSAGKVVLVFSATVFPDGDIYQVAAHTKAVEDASGGSDVRVYDSIMVRHWDTWKSTQGEVEQLFFVKLSRNPESFASSEEEDGFEHVQLPVGQQGQWSMASKTGAGFEGRRPYVYSPMANSTLECPVGPFGGAGDFDISSTHLLFSSKDPLVNPAWHTRTQIYLVPLSPRTAADAKPKIITVGTQGAASSPAFSKDGKRIAWLEMREDGNEADRNRVIVYEIESGRRWGATENWDRSPGSVSWCPCGEKLYLITEDQGHVKLFQLGVPVERSDNYVSPAPDALTSKHVVNSISPITNSSVLITSSSFTTPNTLSILTLDPRPSTTGTPPPSASLSPLATLTPTLSSKSLDKGESFWFSGSEGVEVHGFIMFPPNYSESSGKKYPLAFIVHGGPQSAFTDSWSTRWNPQIYAAAGYITVLINPTGSTGYGQDFTDAIQNQWGGKPFQDLVAGLEFVKSTFPIDPSRMAMLGASYGGFMANWIQGHNDLCGFSTLVSHDGVFSTSGTYYETDELYFAEQCFGGTPWDVPANYQRWDPQNHIKKWKTPMLVIHSGRDYRLTESQGLGVFNTLQRLNIPSRFVYFESENHWVLKPQNSLRWHEEVLKWIGEWTGEEKREL